MKPAALREILPLSLVLVSCAAAPVVLRQEPAAPVEAGAPDRIRFPRTPALSPDGSRICFSWQGDLWIVPREGGVARRLTVHPAYDSRPLWSPDGTRIAYTSDRHGNEDVFVLDARGGEPARLTFHSAADGARAWLRDGSGIVFASTRLPGEGRHPSLHLASPEGGLPKPFGAMRGADLAIDSDGKIALVRGGSPWWRRGYRGSGNSDLWLLEGPEAPAARLTTFEGDDFHPMWGEGGALYHLRDVDGEKRLHRLDPGARESRPVEGPPGSLRFPSISADGRSIVAEHGDGLVVLDLAAGAFREIEIRGGADVRANATASRVVTSGASDYEVSPDGEEIALVAEGEIFVVRREEKRERARNVTDHPAREESPAWASDSKAIVFVSDREGGRDLYRVESADPDEPRLSRALSVRVTRLTETPEEEASPRFSPKGDRLAFVRGFGDLVVAKPDTSEPVVLLSGWDAPSDFRWSPDGRWIAFSRDDDEFNTEVWIVPSEGGEPFNVTRHPDRDFGPAWSEDGRMLAFQGRRGVEPNTDLYFVWLRKADDEKTAEEIEDERKAAKKKKEKKGGAPKKESGAEAGAETRPAEEPKDDDEEKDEDEKKKPDVEVRIDFEGMTDRIRRILALPGDQTGIVVAPEGERFVFASDHEGRRDLYSVKWTGEDVESLTSGGAAPSDLRVADGLVHYLRSGGRIEAISPDGKTKKSYPFRGRRLEDRPRERAVVFEEAWRTMRDRFYDPGYHGADWEAARAKWAPYAAIASDPEDFQDVVLLLLGELNSSHTGYSLRRGEPGDPSDATGELGVIWDPAHAGPGLRVAEVVPRSPADREASKISPGDVVVAIDGVEVGPERNPYPLLDRTAGEELLLAVRNSADEERRVAIRPIGTGAFADLLYDRRVERNRAAVHAKSGGRLGYLHIRSMSMGPLERFERELYDEGHGREGLIIDVRNNGGGSTADYLLAILGVREHAVTVPRGGGRGYPQDRRPLASWSKPIAVLCDEFSFSNAEIFSWAVKTLGRGTVVGRPTFGGVISTGSATLLDGSTIRTPFRGWFVAGTEINMERQGCSPDVVVENLPGDDEKGIDRQLDAAIAVLSR